jgi:hypothetical protein
LWIAAKLSDSWKSPFEVAPSPKVTRVTADSPRRRLARAAPTACGIWVPTLLEGESS